jgi:hypothetical protein
MSKPTRQELDRIIVGNQIMIMRTLALVSKNLVGDMNYTTELNIRVKDTKDWWKAAYDEEVGFAVSFDKYGK